MEIFPFNKGTSTLVFYLTIIWIQNEMVRVEGNFSKVKKSRKKKGM